MTTEHIEISELILLENNPRRIKQDQFDKLVKSLKEDPEFFECRPCLVHKTNEGLIVYAGNQRVRAALVLKWESVPCIIEEHLSQYIMDARVIKDNMHYGEFDYDLLNSIYDVDLLLDAGFTAEQLTGDFGLNLDSSKDESKSDSDSKKQKTCPNCGHCF